MFLVFQPTKEDRKKKSTLNWDTFPVMLAFFNVFLHSALPKPYDLKISPVTF